MNLRGRLAEQRGPAYFVLLRPAGRSLPTYGPNSPQVEAEARRGFFLTSLERLFLSRLDGRDGETLFLLTADHGASETDPATTIYLNTNRDFAGLERYLKVDRPGKILVPAGSPRDVFLYVQDERLEEARDFLARRLAGRAVVCRTADLVVASFFGAHRPR